MLHWWITKLHSSVSLSLCLNPRFRLMTDVSELLSFERKTFCCWVHPNWTRLLYQTRSWYSAFQNFTESWLPYLCNIYFTTSCNQQSTHSLRVTIMYNGASQVALVLNDPPASAGDIRNTGSIHGLGRSPGRGPGNPLQYSCLENPMDRGAWRATVHCDAESDSTKAT